MRRRAGRSARARGGRPACCRTRASRGWRIRFTISTSPELADLRSQLEIPLAAGEHLYHLDAFRTLLDARAVDVLILDLARVGGITPWRAIAALARSYQIPVCGHVVPEIQVHLLSAVPNGHMVEYVPRSAGILTAMPAPRAGRARRAIRAGARARARRRGGAEPVGETQLER